MIRYIFTVASVTMTLLTMHPLMLIPAAYFGYKFGTLIEKWWFLLRRFVDKKETLHFLFWYAVVAPTLLLMEYWYITISVGVIILIIVWRKL